MENRFNYIRKVFFFHATFFAHQLDGQTLPRAFHYSAFEEHFINSN